MRFPEAVFEVVRNDQCPFYELGDYFRLSGKALLLDHDQEKTFISTTIIKLPCGKSSCRIVIEDISETLIRYKSVERLPGHTFDCSGCTGKIRLQFRSEKKAPLPEKLSPASGSAEMQEALKNFSFFRVLDDHLLRDFLPFLKLKRFSPGETIIRKGTPGRNLYVIVSGKVEILGRDDISIVFLGKGEVFGEMSLLSGDPVTATVKVIAPTKVLYIKRDEFTRLFNKSSALKMYFTRLLSRRLAEVNILRSEEFGSGVMGKLSDMPPAELFQIFNVNQKTGVLRLTLSGGAAALAFRDGNLIRAEYGAKAGREAFFEILREKRGRFKFMQGLSPEDQKAHALGDLTWLLMDGVRRLDEEKDDHQSRE
ncbi:Crp/Fnr family transcriptional regulator [Desulfonema ishimotonii]|uniref:Crp/Fnr family transcriptional regulator n=1 Tax=Desulfonema ishimotonii TaxID=45657 RepID=A0A401FTT9_9BACT|nr:cyclic nucleotide-binding domain-containing protein [Desulfonema ishimotonii]GBC60392.1 Crp/Fnr family transcriptional regulator [Desulfonema ishimotonii]